VKAPLFFFLARELFLPFSFVFMSLVFSPLASSFSFFFLFRVLARLCVRSRFLCLFPSFWLRTISRRSNVRV